MNSVTGMDGENTGVFILDRYAVKKREDGRGMTIDDGRRTKGRGMIASGKADSLREWMDQ